MILDQHSTERLRFRCLTPEDKNPLMDFFTDPESIKYFPPFDDPEKFTEDWITCQLRRYQLSQGGIFAIELKHSGELLGQSGLVRQFVDGIPKWEVDYHLFRAYWGNGYATEAARACRDFCFENEMAETLISIIHPENEKSKAVANRNLMLYWKTTLFKGQTCEVYRVRREDWEKRV